MAAKVITFLLRLPPTLHAAIKALAMREHRSVHAQIVTLLEEALTTRRQRP